MRDEDAQTDPAGSGQNDVYFGGFRLDPVRRTITRDGVPVALGGRAFDLLIHLLTHRDRIVSRGEAFEAVWGPTALDENNLGVQVAALRKALGPQVVLTVPRRGLRFGYSVQGGAERDAISLAVLRFDSPGGDATPAWLADSLAEDISTELARFPDLMVIARNSAFAVSGLSVDHASVSRMLGVRYLVTGSVRQAGDMLRLSVHLADTNSGARIWAETYDCATANRFSVLDAIAGAVASSIGPQVWAAEARRLRRTPPQNPTAHDLAQRAWAAVWPFEMTQDQTPRDAAIDLAQQALAIDDQSALALRTIAYALFWTVYFARCDDPETVLMKGLTSAAAAIASDPLDHHAHRQKGLLHFLAGEPNAGLIDLRRAHQINPNCALTRSWLALYEATHGNAEAAVGHAQTALRLSPLDPMIASLQVSLAFTHFVIGNYADSEAAALAAVQHRPAAATPYLIAALAHVGTGSLDAASAAFTRLNALAPAMAQARLQGIWLSPKDEYRNRAQTFLQVAAGITAPDAAVALGAAETA